MRICAPVADPETACGRSGEADCMTAEVEELKRKLEEMLASTDTGWASAVSVTFNAMYREFKREQLKKTIVPFAAPRQCRSIPREARKRASD